MVITGAASRLLRLTLERFSHPITPSHKSAIVTLLVIIHHMRRWGESVLQFIAALHQHSTDRGLETKVETVTLKTTFLGRSPRYWVRILQPGDWFL